MKRTVLLVCLCTIVAAAFSQTGDASQYAGHINSENLKKHLSIIAGDEMEGRETGTEGQRKAAAYIESQFKKIGLQKPKGLKGYKQEYPLYKDSVNVTSCTVKLNSEELKYGQDYLVNVYSNDSKKITAKEFVFAGYGISEEKYDDYKNIDVKDKVVVFFMGEPKENGKFLLTGSAKSSKYTYPGIAEKMKIAVSKGAAAAIIVNPIVPLITENLLSTNSKTKIYYPRNAEGAAGNYLVASHKVLKTFFAAWGDSLVGLARRSVPFNTSGYSAVQSAFSFDYKRERQIIYASNVLGVIEGTDKKDEYVFLTAHYDHLGKKDGKIYYGADDDGSGTCAVLTMAEAFAKAKKDGHGQRRTIVFMTVSGEEKGLWGSEYYTDHPVFPLDKTTVDLNTDMIGRVDTERPTADSLNYVYVVGHDKISTDLQKINEGANTKNTGLVLDYKFDDPNDPERIYYRSDHYNFARKGVPVLFFYDGMLKADYHKPTDTIDKINWDLYSKRAQMIFYTAWEMANRDSMLMRDIPLPAEEE